MDKSILQEYIDACELIKETEKDICRLEQKRKTVVQTAVKGSMKEFPYTEQHFRIQGTAFTVNDDRNLRHEEKVLAQRKEDAERIRHMVEEWMQGIPPRMQRIVRYRYLEGMTWEQVAMRMGRKATADSVRKGLYRFLKEN